MAWVPAVGDEADHPSFGRIIVVATDGKSITYRFKDDCAKQYRCDAFLFASNSKLVKRQSIQPIVQPAAPNTQTLQTQQIQKKERRKAENQDKKLYRHTSVEDSIGLNAIDALRFGLVPRDKLIDLSMFKEAMEKFYQDSLPYAGNTEQPKVNLVSGAFGEGKSHTMTYVRERAIEDGYLVASVEVNGVEITLAKPDTLIYSIFSNITGKDLSRPYSMVDLYQKAVVKKYTGPNVVTSYHRDKNRNKTNYELIKWIHEMGKIEEVDDLLQDLLTCNMEVTVTDIKQKLAERLSIPNMQINLSRIIGTTVEERPADFIVALISATLIAKRAGYKGILVTFDEWEVQTLASTKRDRERVEALLNTIRSFFTKEKIKAPIAFYIFNVPAEDSDVTDLLRTVAIESKGTTYAVPTIRSWDRNNLEIRNMFEKIHELYKKCYNCNGLSDEDLMDTIDYNIGLVDFSESGAIRQITKLLVSTLDQEYSPPYLK